MADQYQAKPYNEKLDNLRGISKDTNRAHYGLYEVYVKKFNEGLERLSASDKSAANQIFSDYRAASVELTFALGGIKNHEVYFGHLGGDGKAVEGKFKAEIEKTFKDWDSYLADLRACGMAARGWAWTVWDDDLQILYNTPGDQQNTYAVWNAHPVVALDVYEHAYMRDFLTARPKYIDAFLDNMDWQVVEDSFNKIHG
jgi:Fe-Mn family superoxide dismutase